MHKQLPAWQLIQKSLQNNVAVMLLYVLESKGSSPGRQGFMMVVNAGGEMSGSLGGGIMEHKFVELAKSKLLEAMAENSVHHQVHDKAVAKNQSGMICSGEQTIFLYTVKKEDGPAINNIISSLQKDHNATLQLSTSGIIFKEDIPLKNFDLQVKDKDDFVFTEKTGYKHKLYIIGGGHCSLALSQLMSNLDFYIHLFDHRANLNTLEQNDFVHEKSLLDDYAALTTLVPSSEYNFVIVMTVGYRTDADAIKALSGKDFKYLGILGSKNKMAKMVDQLIAEGIDKTWLEKVNAPAGIQIKSQTPQEIAVSIAAEIIRVKNESL